MDKLSYEHDFIDNQILERVLKLDDYADHPELFADDLAKAFHWAATPQGHQHWLAVSCMHPTRDAITAVDREYLEWLLAKARGQNVA